MPAGPVVGMTPGPEVETAFNAWYDTSTSPPLPASWCPVRAPLPDERRQPEIRGALPSCIAGGGRHTGVEAGERVDPMPSRCATRSAIGCARLPELRARVGSLRATARGGYIPGSNQHDTHRCVYECRSAGIDHGGLTGRPVMGSKARAPITGPAGIEGVYALCDNAFTAT